MTSKRPCVYILASRRNGTLCVGVTNALIETHDPEWRDLHVEPIA